MINLAEKVEATQLASELFLLADKHSSYSHLLNELAFQVVKGRQLNEEDLIDLNEQYN